MRWLDQQLAQAQAFPARIVFGHVPLYAYAFPKENEVIGDPALDELLRRHRVSAFITGHHHAYYPGRRGEVRFVSTACLGSGQRTLLGDSERSVRSYLELEIDASGIISLEAWRYPGFTEVIERATLPASVGEGAERIVRDDLAHP